MCALGKVTVMQAAKVSSNDSLALPALASDRPGRRLLAPRKFGAA
jgi:hypothetical protein